MRSLATKIRKPNRLLALTAKALSILSVFALSKLDHAHADMKSINEERDDSRRSSFGDDIVYAGVADVDIDEQWGGGGPPPVPE